MSRRSSMNPPIITSPAGRTLTKAITILDTAERPTKLSPILHAGITHITIMRNFNSKPFITEGNRRNANLIGTNTACASFGAPNNKKETKIGKSDKYSRMCELARNYEFLVKRVQELDVGEGDLVDVEHEKMLLEEERYGNHVVLRSLPSKFSDFKAYRLREVDERGNGKVYALKSCLVFPNGEPCELTYQNDYFDYADRTPDYVHAAREIGNGIVEIETQSVDMMALEHEERKRKMAANTPRNEGFVKRTQALIGDKPGDLLDNRIGAYSKCVACDPSCKLPFPCNGQREPGPWVRFENNLTFEFGLRLVLMGRIPGNSVVFDADESRILRGALFIPGRGRRWSLTEVRAYQVSPASPDLVANPPQHWVRREKGSLLMAGGFIPLPFIHGEHSVLIVGAFDEVVDARR